MGGKTHAWGPRLPLSPGAPANYHSLFTYPIFGEAQTIFGYQDLHINLRFAVLLSPSPRRNLTLGGFPGANSTPPGRNLRLGAWVAPPACLPTRPSSPTVACLPTRPSSLATARLPTRPSIPTLAVHDDPSMTLPRRIPRGGTYETFTIYETCGIAGKTGLNGGVM